MSLHNCLEPGGGTQEERTFNYEIETQKMETKNHENKIK